MAKRPRKTMKASVFAAKMEPPPMGSGVRMR